jgi:hypothetical protein
MGQKTLAQIDGDAFLKHLDDASEVVRSWEPWKRAILGRRTNGSSGNGREEQQAPVQCSNQSDNTNHSDDEKK